MVALVLSLGVANAFADNHTITITQPATEDGTPGAESYVAYKIFDVAKTDGVTEAVTTNDTLGAGTATGFAYTISSDSAWYSVVNASGYFTLTATAADPSVYNVALKDPNTDTPANENNTADVAKAIAAYLLKNKPSDEALTAAGDEFYSFSASNRVATVNVNDGYYLITSSLGTNLVLATSDINITTKNEYITDEKTVARTSYNVGDIVTYTIKVNLPASIDYTKPVTVHDTMDDVLRLITDTTGVNAWTATVGEDNFASHVTLVESANFGANHDASHAAANGKTLFDFVLDISSLAPAAGTDPVAKTVVLTYKAELTSAALDDYGYVNEEFSEYSEYETNPNDVKVYTFDIDLSKTFTGVTEGKENYRATFELRTAVTGGTVYEFVKEDDTHYVVADAEAKAVANYDADAAKVITVNGKDTVNIRGLDAGTYYLVETSTADGFNALTEPVIVTITDKTTGTQPNLTVAHEVSYKIGENGTVKTGTVGVENNSGTVLPSTGGIGTTIFYVVGGVLVLAAIILLVTKKRMSE